MPCAVLSNYLWIRKSDVKGTPSDFAPNWEYKVPLLSTPEGRMLHEQMVALDEESDDPESTAFLDSLPKHMVVKTWANAGDKWMLCAGDMKKVRALTGRLNLDIKDKRVDHPWPKVISDRVKMIMSPRDYQVGPLEAWMNAGHGVFKAAPAFGKTFIMVSATVRLHQWTLVLTHTDYLADQFLKRIREGSPKKKSDDEEQGYDPVTNILDVEEELGLTIAGRYKGPDHLYPITVSTYQSFISETGVSSLKEIANKFGVVLVDECHVFAAPAPSKVINSLKAKTKLGVSATPDRKDTMQSVLYDSLGPITAIGSAAQLPVTATLIATGAEYKGGRVPRRGDWAWMLNSLCKNEDRNDLIFKWASYDVENGRKLLLLSDRRNWCLDMADRLTKAGIPSEAVLGGMTSAKGKEARENTVQSMMDGDIDVICATQVFKLGVDIPCLDTMYGTCPMSNRPLLEQMLGRIRRSYEGKQEPLFRYFVDGGHGVLYGCAKSTNKHLTELGATVVLLPEGAEPGFSAYSDGYETARKESSDGRSKRRGLRRMASKSTDSVKRLFDDISNESRLTNRYQDRMKK